MAEEPMRTWGFWRMRSARFVVSVLLCAFVPCVTVAAQNPAARPSKELQLNLAAQPVSDSLSQLAEAAGLQIIFYSEAAQGLQAPQLAGSFDVAAALDRLLAN